MTWHLNPPALEALRDVLLARGAAPQSDLSRQPDAAPPEGSPEAEALLRRIAPLLELLYLMMITDGECDDRERQLLRGVTRTLGGSVLPNGTVERLLLTFDAHVDAEGAESRLERLAAELSAERLDAEAAFTLAATMALADGHVDTLEHAISERLAELLGISPRRVVELVAACPFKARIHPAP